MDLDDLEAYFKIMMFASIAALVLASGIICFCYLLVKLTGGLG